MIAAPRKRIILQDGEQVKLHQPARDDEGFSPAAKIDDRPKGRYEGFVDCRKTERADHVIEQQSVSIRRLRDSDPPVMALLSWLLARRADPKNVR
jgi:hypothetical protein